MTVNQKNKGLHIALWIVQGLLAVAFGMSGMMKIGTPIAEMLENGMTYAGRLPEGVVRFIGVSEMLGAIGLILPAATRILPALTAAAGAALTLVMVLAVGDHFRHGEFMVVPPVILGGLAAFVAWGRGFKVPIESR